ncbi:hypothetical protein C4571_03880 [Candidatus Parcubacteria bacterium]|nr:MAG: hypothetical protein C4571_03880 [Candidatus Parcubacteria bacterium]
MILGHGRVVEDLKRLAERKGLSHGYVFFGPEGVGKRLVAQSLANHLEGGQFEPPQNRVLTDALFIEPDAEGTIGVGVIRSIKYFLWQRPVKSAYRLVLIDSGEALTPEAQNALLKITEEPPSYGLLILVVREPEFFQPTLLSRLQKIYFSTVSQGAIKEWLITEHTIKPKEAEAIAERSFGKPGRAWVLVRADELDALYSFAKKALSVGIPNRRDFIKKLIESETFRFEAFLDAMISVVGEEPIASKTKIDPSGRFRIDAELRRSIEFWHRLLELRSDARYYNLNPRIQLESLLSNQ